MKTWKKNVVAAGVLVTVCAGIYLNWLYTEDMKPVSFEDTLDAGQILDESMLVMNPDSAGEQPDTASDYFAAIRLSRQEARDSAVTLLQEAMAYDTASDGASARELEQIVENALSEAQIESLVVAKGYGECVAYLSDDGISVAVSAPEEGLSQSDVAVITDIVLTQSDCDVEDIHIVPVS